MNAFSAAESWISRTAFLRLDSAKYYKQLGGVNVHSRVPRPPKVSCPHTAIHSLTSAMKGERSILVGPTGPISTSWSRQDEGQYDAQLIRCSKYCTRNAGGHLAYKIHPKVEPIFVIQASSTSTDLNTAGKNEKHCYGAIHKGRLLPVHRPQELARISIRNR